MLRGPFLLFERGKVFQALARLRRFGFAFNRAWILTEPTLLTLLARKSSCIIILG